MRRTAATLPIVLSLIILGLVILGLALGPAQAQQSLCARKVRHVTCHFPDGKTVLYDTDANAEFYNIPPYMTFRTADGAVHNIIGNCEIVCRP